jgi:hypothetical protein
VAGCCECGDESSGSCTTELVSLWREYIVADSCSIVCDAVYCNCISYLTEGYYVNYLADTEQIKIITGISTLRTNKL